MHLALVSGANLIKNIRVRRRRNKGNGKPLGSKSTSPSHLIMQTQSIGRQMERSQTQVILHDAFDTRIIYTNKMTAAIGMI